MALQEPMRPTTCDRCGTPFNTSDVHPSRFCSIACEEGRTPLPESDPASPGYPNYLQGNPEALVGQNLLACGLKRTCYSPDWHRSPSDYNVRMIVSNDEENEILVYKTDVYLGTVVEYSDGEYAVEHEDMETGEISTRWIDDSLTLSQIRQDNWWVE